MGEESRGYRNSYSIALQGFCHLPLTISPILPVPRSHWGTCMAVVRQQSFHLLSTQLPLRKQAFRVMLGLFISYKDVIRQINSADTQGCVFNGCVLPRLVISRQPLLQNHTLHPRPCIRNLTTSSSTVMKAYVSHRLGLSHLPASFDVGIHTEPLCKSLVRASVSFSSRLSMLSFAARRCIQIKRMCFCLRGADFHLSQSPLWLNSSWPWSTCPGLLLWVAPGEPMSRFHTPGSSPTFNDLPMVIFTKRLFFYWLGINFPSLWHETFSLNWIERAENGNRKWPSKMQINLWENLFVYLLYVSIFNLWHCVHHKYDLAASFSLLSQWCSVIMCSKKLIFFQFFHLFVYNLKHQGMSLHFVYVYFVTFVIIWKDITFGRFACIECVIVHFI